MIFNDGFQQSLIFTILFAILMENSGEIFSLWVGPNSQQLAHHFYALQAEQFFEESEDPTQHSCIWKLIDSHGQRKRPYFLTFDTQIPHLNYLRKVNHRKILAEMEKSHTNMEHYFFPVEHKKPQPTQDTQEKDKYLYERWDATQFNYALVDNNFIQDCDSFEHWKEVFTSNKDVYEDKVRKHLQGLDMLKYITFTSDLERSGFSQELMFYLRDQCPKKDIHFFQLQGTKKSGFYEVSQLQSLAELGTLADVFLQLKAEIPQFPYFESANPFVHLAPLMNCLITPLCLKDASKQNYLSNILINPRRNIFDIAYTVPIIDSELRLSRKTDIFDYLLENRHDKFFEEQELILAGKKFEESDIQKENMLHLLQENEKNRINYTADFIGLRKMVKQHPHEKVKEQLYTELISEAYVLKGQVNKFEKLFTPNCQLLDLKYLEGILCNYTGNQAKYNQAYKKQYGQAVVNYPFHCVMFQHKKFADHLRNVATFKNKKNKHELENDWKENLMAQADFYKEVIEEEDD